MNLKNIFGGLSLIVFIGVLSACAAPTVNSPKEEAGVFKSSDYGEKWEQKNFAGLDGKKKLSLGSVDTKEIVFDSNDLSLVYLATRGNGLFVSENEGGEWRQIYKTGFVGGLSLDSKSRGVIYIAVDNKVLKSVDQGKEWNPVYTETRPEVLVTQVVVDPGDVRKIYLSTSAGDVILSTNAGESWKNSLTTQDNVRRLLINPKNPKIIYAATLNAGIYRSADGGQNWKNLKENYQKIKGYIGRYHAMALDPGVTDGLFFVNDYGIIKTSDGGETWQELKLLTPPNSTVINATTINPKDNKQIYYTTANTIYRSFDGGVNWLSSKAPSSRAPAFLIVDPGATNVLYLGVVNISSKPFFFL